MYVDKDLPKDVITTESDDTVDISGIYSSSLTAASPYATSYGTVTISTAAGSNGSYLYSNGTTTGPMWSHNTGVGTGLHVTSDAEFDGDVKIKGVSIAKALEDIQKRLAILVPDPEKLEHFEALKKAYEHYKVLEALCQLPAKEDDA